MVTRTVREARRAASSVVVALALVWGSLGIVLAGPASASSFGPVADSFVDATRPAANFGTRTNLRLDGSPVKVSYLRFEVEGVGTTSSGVLRVFVESTHRLGFELRTVPDDSWTETGITYGNAPPVGAVLTSSGAVTGGRWYTLDVSGAVSGDGIYSFALTTPDNTAIAVSSRESANAPQLIVPAPPGPSPYVVSRNGATYQALSQGNGTTFTGSLKFVVEAAVEDLDDTGGGDVIFGSDTYELGADHFELFDVANITFAGQGVDATFLRNATSAADDTEPFDFVGADRITIRDMTISAGGAARSTSDAIDFDDGNDSVVERVRVVASRGRGIVFDGKGAGWTAVRNRITDCIISGIPGDGIELLASSQNTISGCSITDVGGHGIQVNKSSLSASQPNKQSNDNQIIGNSIDQSGQDGINVISGARNRLTSNVITNSADDVASRDGVRITSADSVTCDDNVVEDNVLLDNQVVHTQRYGLNISSAGCHRTVVAGNTFEGNVIAAINDLGTDTDYGQDGEPPSAPTGLSATVVGHARVDLAWSASSDDVGVDTYTVYRDGSQVAVVDGSTTVYSDTTVNAETTYEYRVDAADAAGNRSAPSDPAFATIPAVPTSFTVSPVADTYVDESNPARNFGGSTSLRVDGSPVVRSYLRFDVTGLEGPPVRATFRIRANSSSSVGHQVWSVADNSWTETTMTWTTAPAIGASLGSSGAFTSGTWIEVDVTSFITGDGTYSIAITTPGSTAISFASHESSAPPELVIQRT